MTTVCMCSVQNFFLKYFDLQLVVYMDVEYVDADPEDAKGQLSVGYMTQISLGTMLFVAPLKNKTATVLSESPMVPHN